MPPDWAFRHTINQHAELLPNTIDHHARGILAEVCILFKAHQQRREVKNVGFHDVKGVEIWTSERFEGQKLAWGDIARCQQVANNDVCFVVVTNREKEIKFECDNQVQRDAWCKYINENKTGALACTYGEKQYSRRTLGTKIAQRKPLRRRTTSGMFSMKNPLSLFSVMLENRVIFQIVGNTLLAFFR